METLSLAPATCSHLIHYYLEPVKATVSLERTWMDLIGAKEETRRKISEVTVTVRVLCCRLTGMVIISNALCLVHHQLWEPSSSRITEDG